MRLNCVWMSMIVLVMGSAAYGQSSSLYVREDQEDRSLRSPAPGFGQWDIPLASQVASSSLMAVPLPEPRTFTLHDLVTIVVREATSSDSSASLETEKALDLNGEISALPEMALINLLKMQFDQHIDSNNAPELGVGFDSSFEGDGEYSREDTFTAQLTAEIVDIKPNGTLVLEARKFIRSDKETLEIVVSGVCRPEDVNADNTILSTDLANLRVAKAHEGELRRASKKGLFTKLFETIFNF